VELLLSYKPLKSQQNHINPQEVEDDDDDEKQQCCGVSIKPLL